MYESGSRYGQKTYWIQLPLKYYMLSTVHALTGRGCDVLMLHLNYFWCHGAVFAALTRAKYAPPPVEVPLAGLPGVVGICELNRLNFKLRDPSGVALGLHPIVAIYFKDVQKKKVNEEREASARVWLEQHNEFHLAQEQIEIHRTKAAQQAAAGPSGAASSSRTMRYGD